LRVPNESVSCWLRSFSTSMITLRRLT
jgi:hypothetical protein